MLIKKTFERFVELFRGVADEKSKSLSMPKFWQHKSVFSGIMPELLMPFAVIFYFYKIYRERTAKPEKLSVPVLCVGNVTVGGAGKTPTAIALAKIFQAKGSRPYFVSRGYLGGLDGPVKVDLEKHTFRDVGDEPLLLARIAPTYIGVDRLAAAKLAISEGAGMLILDDGLQNYSIQKDLSFSVIDGGFGFGNYFTIPAGPLREPVPAAMKKSAAAIIIGDDKFKIKDDLRKFIGNILLAKIKVSGTEDLHDKKISAFAGIGRPQKFFDSLKQAGIKDIIEQGFPDHHDYTDEDIENIIATAEKESAIMVTTEKDAVRLPEYFRKRVRVIAAEVEFEDYKILEIILRKISS